MAISIQRTAMFSRFARLLGHTQVVPLLRTHIAPPTHDHPLKMPHVSQVFLQQLANLHVLQAASGWVWGGGGTVCFALFSWQCSFTIPLFLYVYLTRKTDF